MRELFSMVMTVVFIIVACALLMLGGQAFGFWSFSYYAPRYEEVRRQTFEQSRAFNEGMSRDIQNLIANYYAANSDAGKQAILATINQRLADVDQSKLPPDVRQFLSEVK